MEVASDRPARGLSGLSARTVAAVLVLMALVVASVVLGLKVREASADEARREAVLRAARQEAVNFTTIDYRHLERDFGRVLEGATGEFEKEFSSGRGELEELLRKNETVSEGEVLEAGIVNADDDSAKVLVVVDSEVRNTGEPQGTVRHYRMQMDLVYEDGSWRTSSMAFVG